MGESEDSVAPERDPRRFARRGWVAIPVSIFVIDMVVRWGEHWAMWFLADINAIIASVFGSFLGWWSLTLLLAALPTNRLRAGVASALALFVGFLLCAVWQFKIERFYDVSPDIIALLWLHPGNGAALASTGVTAGYLVAWLVLSASMAILLIFASNRPSPPRRDVGTAGAVLIGLVPVFTLVFPTLEESPGSAYLSDVRTMKVLVEGGVYIAEGRGSSMPGLATRDKVTAKPSRSERPNILLFVGESLTPDYMSAFVPDMEHDSTPRLRQFLTDHRDDVYLYDRSFANSAGTRFAVMGIVLGQYHGAPREALYSAPAIWQYAAAAGSRSLVVSTQSWDWANLKEFFVTNQPPTAFRHAGDMELPTVNDTGVDDREAAKVFIEELDKLGDEPFVAVFQSNATHWPFLRDVDVPWGNESKREIYTRAMRIVDDANFSIVDALRKRGMLENTVIIHTADHAVPVESEPGESAAVIKVEPAMGEGVRLNSCEPMFARVPTWIYVPAKWRQQLGLAAIEANRQTPVSHVDVVPTIADLLGFDAAALDLPGASMVRQLPSDRATYCFTTPSWTLSHLTGMSIYEADRITYTRRDFRTVRVFDTSDPDVFNHKTVGREARADELEQLKSWCETRPLLKPTCAELRKGPLR